jgi:hypothetical protein
MPQLTCGGKDSIRLELIERETIVRESSVEREQPALQCIDVELTQLRMKNE